MKSLSCVIVFLGSVLALCGITYEEIQTGKDLKYASQVFMVICILSCFQWWREMRKGE